MQEVELDPRLGRLQRALAATYWLVVLLVLAYALSPLAAGEDRTLLTGLAILAAVFNLVHYLVPERHLKSMRVWGLMVVSAFFSLMLIELTGGLGSPFFFTLLLLTLAAFVGLSRAGALALTVAASLYLGAQVIRSGAPLGFGVLVSGGVRIGSLWVVAFVGTFLAQELALAHQAAEKKDRAQRSLDVLAVVRDSLSGTGDRKALLQEVVDRLSFTLGVPAAAVFLLDDEKQALVLTAQKGIPLDSAEQVAVQNLTSGDPGLAARAAKLRGAVVLDDLIAHPLADEIREASLLSGLRSMASMPLLSRGQVVGVLQLFSEKEGYFADSYAETLQSLCTELALVIANIRLEEQERRRKAELEALHSVTQRSTASQTTEDAVRSTVEAIDRLGYPTAAVLLFDERRRELVVQASPNLAPEQWWRRIPVGTGVTGQAAASGEPVVVADTARHPGYISRGGGARSEIALPLKVKGRLIGVLDVEHPRPRAFGEDEVHVLASFANQAAVAIDSARLYEWEKVRAEQLDALREYSTRVVQTAQTESEVIAALLHYLKRLTRPDQAVMYRPGHENGPLEVVQRLGEPGRCGESPLIEPSSRCIAFRTGTRYRFDGPADLPCPVKSPAGGSAHYLCLPVVVAGEVNGVVHLDSEREGHWDEERVRLCRAFVNFTAPMLQNIRYTKQLSQEAIVDELTGLHNRRFLEGHLAKQLAMAARYGQPLAVLMLDIDHFKEVNDRFGHDVGDSVLRSFASCLSRAVRASDVVARWGGEEFVVVLPSTDARSAQALAEKIRTAVERLRFDDLVPGLAGVTVSIGAASFPEHAKHPEVLMKSADLALYRAKERGRNRVEAPVV
jgi:diguanylate cyclase (GGDEF)-like protein